MSFNWLPTSTCKLFCSRYVTTWCVETSLISTLSLKSFHYTISAYHKLMTFSYHKRMSASCNFLLQIIVYWTCTISKIVLGFRIKIWYVSNKLHNQGFPTAQPELLWDHLIIKIIIMILTRVLGYFCRCCSLAFLVEVSLCRDPYMGWDKTMVYATPWYMMVLKLCGCLS